MPKVLTHIVLLTILIQIPAFSQGEEPTIIGGNYQIILPFETTSVETPELITIEGSDTNTHIVINRRNIGSSPDDSLTVSAYSEGEIAGMNIRKLHTVQSDIYKRYNDILVRTMNIISDDKLFTNSYFADSNFVYVIRLSFTNKKGDQEYVNGILETLKKR